MWAALHYICIDTTPRIPHLVTLCVSLSISPEKNVWTRLPSLSSNTIKNATATQHSAPPGRQETPPFQATDVPWATPPAQSLDLWPPPRDDTCGLARTVRHHPSSTLCFTTPLVYTALHASTTPSRKRHIAVLDTCTRPVYARQPQARFKEALRPYGAAGRDFAAVQRSSWL